MILALSVSALTTTIAHADERLEGLKKINTDFCKRAGTHLPDAPKDAAQVEPYCHCVSDSYWESVPKSEVDELLGKGTSPAIQANLKPRMKAAQLGCKKKIGF